MTSNQIAYWRNVETERSNRAQEAEAHRSHLANEEETKRHNIMNEVIGFGTLRETERHNLAYEHELTRHNVETELLGRDTLAESRRHNTVVEDISYGQLYETQRHNIASENLGYDNLYENRRHNYASEQNTRYVADLNASTTLAKTQLEVAQSERNSERSLEGSIYGADFGYKAALLAHSDRLEAMNIERSQNMISNQERQRHNLAEEKNTANANKLRLLDTLSGFVVDEQRIGLEGVKTLGNLAETAGKLIKLAK